MRKSLKIKKHIEYYVSLIIIESVCLLLVLMNAQNRSLQMFFIILMAGIYALWAIVHHHIHHNLSTKIVVEYILIGVLGVTLTLFLSY